MDDEEYALKAYMKKLKTPGSLSKPITVGSFWGAFAALLLFQIMVHLCYNSFIVLIQSFNICAIAGLLFILIFALIQSNYIRIINNYLSKNKLERIFTLLKEKDELLRFIFAIFFSLILVAFLLGYYPFPTIQGDVFMEFAFYLLMWTVSLVSIKLNMKPTKILIGGKFRNYQIANRKQLIAVFFLASIPIVLILLFSSDKLTALYFSLYLVPYSILVSLILAQLLVEK